MQHVSFRFLRRKRLPVVLLAVFYLIAGSAFPASHEFLVPAYANPCCADGPAMWDAMVAAALDPEIALSIIFNPASGPGSDAQVDPNFVGPTGEGILVDVHDAGALLYGYIQTEWATREIAAVKADIDKYYDLNYWRGAGVLIGGIFFDEMSNDLADVGYYNEIRDYVRSKDATSRIVGNPGTSYVNNPSEQTQFTVDDYVHAADLLMTFETTLSEYLTNYTPPVWWTDYGRERFAHIVYDVGSAEEMVHVLELAFSRKAGVIYVTHDILENPYDALPTFWQMEIAAAKALLFVDGFEVGSTEGWTSSTP